MSMPTVSASACNDKARATPRETSANATPQPIKLAKWFIGAGWACLAGVLCVLFRSLFPANGHLLQFTLLVVFGATVAGVIIGITSYFYRVVPALFQTMESWVGAATGIPAPVTRVLLCFVVGLCLGFSTLPLRGVPALVYLIYGAVTPRFGRTGPYGSFCVGYWLALVVFIKLYVFR